MKSKSIHLSLLMFFQVSVPGAFIPIMSLYLQDYLGFSSLQIGVILSIPSIPSLIIPLLSLFVVDKLITARRFMIVCHLISAVVIFILAISSSYISVLLFFSLYMAAVVPTYGLINTLIFANLDNKKSYTAIRVWGTVGWVVSGWLVSFVWKYTKSPENMPIALIISGVFSLVVILLTLRLPKMKIEKKAQGIDLGNSSFSSILKPKVILMFLTILISSIADKFYFYGAPIYLQEIGIRKENIMIFMSVAQIPEILMLFFFKSFIKKVGFKRSFVISLLLLSVRSILFFTGNSVALSVVAIGAGGFVYALLFSGVMVYLDDNTEENSRSNIHQLYNFITIGVCGLAGNFLAGLTADTFRIDNGINFRYFWGFSSILSIIPLLLIILFMKSDIEGRKVKSFKRYTA